MHEHAIIESVIDSIRRSLKLKGLHGQVKSISLKIGALEMHGEESFKQIFAMAAAGTQLQGASLNLTVVPPRIQCQCGHQGQLEGAGRHLDLPIAECPKCGEFCRMEGGRGVDGIDLEFEEPPVKEISPS